MKKLLTSVNQMALAKPDDTHSAMYHKKNKKDGEAIRDAALNEISDTDSDDYINNKSHKKSRESSHVDGEMDVVTDVGGFFNDDNMTIEQEELLREQSVAYAESLTSTDKDDQSWKNTPSTSRNNQFSISEEELQSINVDTVDASVDDGVSSGNVRETSAPVPSVSTLSTNKTVVTMKKILGQTPDTSTSNSRFSNPKKDLINYLQRKSTNEIDLRHEENRIRELEVINKREELEILRLKTGSEVEERKKNSGQEAENKKEELRIRRLKTEAEVEERKKMQDLLIALITKNNSN